MGGAASETPVTLSAAGSFLVFICYFTYVLFSVPRHGDVPYRNRYASASVGAPGSHVLSPVSFFVHSQE